MRKCVITNNAIVMQWFEFELLQNSGQLAERRSSSDSLTSLHSRFIQVKRDFRDIKMTTERQLDDIRSEQV